VLDWGDVRSGATRAEVVLDEGMDRESFRDAFAMVRRVRPPLALWLVVFKDGDSDDLLPGLGDFIKETRNYTRHGVFHWNPERCDYGGATSNRTKRAYKHAAFVFQFAYQDDRLAELDPEKFMPWPLGPAWWKGWQPPKSVLPTSKRGLLASFRGANTSDERSEALVAMGKLSSRTKGVVVEDSGKWVAVLPAEQVSRYQELLASSKYSINVAGHHPNCYRVFEAILSGAVPIVFREPAGFCSKDWVALYGDPAGTKYPWIPKAPFEVLKAVHELPSALARLGSASGGSVAAADAPDPTTEGAESGTALMLWYERWKKAFHDKLIEKLEEQLGDAQWNRIRSFRKGPRRKGRPV